MSTEIQAVLLDVCSALAEAKNQDDRRVQEFNSTVFWLTKANLEGLGQTVRNFQAEVLEAIEKQEGTWRSRTCALRNSCPANLQCEGANKIFIDDCKHFVDMEA
jgi:hypothetical protein